MCIILTKSKKNNKKGLDINVKCTISGKPITITNKYGMFCEDLCGIEKSKKRLKQVEEALKSINTMGKPSEKQFSNFLEKLLKPE